MNSDSQYILTSYFRFLTVELAREARGRRREIPKDGENTPMDPLRDVRNEESQKACDGNRNSEADVEAQNDTPLNEADLQSQEEELLEELPEIQRNEDGAQDDESDASKSLFEDFEMEE